MIRFMMSFGPMLWPILAVLVVILAKVAAAVVRLKRPGGASRVSFDSILVWGGCAAVLGFLGQLIGHYKIAGVVAHAPVISPAKVAVGLSESMLTSILGLWVLLLSGIAWLFLRWRERSAGE